MARTNGDAACVEGPPLAPTGGRLPRVRGWAGSEGGRRPHQAVKQIRKYRRDWPRDRIEGCGEKFPPPPAA
ncbi:hypothetical protein GCM10010433_46980 [Streptomyces pulveraceus]